MCVGIDRRDLNSCTSWLNQKNGWNGFWVSNFFLVENAHETGKKLLTDTLLFIK